MNDFLEQCRCGQPAVLGGRCQQCFAESARHFGVAGVGTASFVFEAGQRFGEGRFTLVEPLGKGGMGTVWRAFHEQLSKEGPPEEVALKFIVGNQATDRELVALLRQEVRASLRLSHPHIVRVHSWHEYEGEPVFYSMEVVEGQDLKQRLADHPAGRFTCQELNPLLAQLVEALDYAHRQKGVIHRDLKPANLLVTHDGTLKLADFGLARPEVSADGTSTTASGTLYYASPAQRRGDGATVADDIYSLGAVLYHLLTGRPPFSEADLVGPQFPPPPVHPWRLLDRKTGAGRDVSAEAGDTLLRCLSVDPEQRPPDVRTFWNWWKTGPPPPPPPPTDICWGVVFRNVYYVTVMLLCLAVLGALAWRNGLDGFLVNHALPVARVGKRIGAGWNALFAPRVGPTTNDLGTNGPPTPSKLANTNLVSLTLHLVGPAAGPVQLEVFHLGTPDQPAVRPLRQASPLILEAGHDLVLTNLETGRYRLEAGTGPLRTGTNWVRQDFTVTEAMANLTVDFRPAGLRVFLSAPASFDLLDSWGRTNAHVGTNEFAEYRLPSMAAAPWRANPVEGLKLLGGRYRLRLDDTATNMLPFEPQEETWMLSPGLTETQKVSLKPWQVPRLYAAWTNTLGMTFLPVLAGSQFLAAGNETTVGQFALFAAANGRITNAIESIADQGATQLGRTWRNAFPEQTPGHPVVGVSWGEAMAFCEWLTQKERTLGRLSPHQRYSLPTTTQWSALVGTDNYPWSGAFPPDARQGNYAGKELKDYVDPALKKPGWPTSWVMLLLASNDPASPHTVPVGYHVNVAGFSDLGGNAAEWCDTWYRTPMNARIPWAVPSRRLADDRGGEYYRVVRGGSWFDQDSDLLRSATHWAEPPETRNDRIGFRVVILGEN